MRLQPRHIIWIKVLIHLAAFTPALANFYLAVTEQLGGDPVKALVHFTGISAFNLLLITLAISPLAKKLKQSQLINTRRVLGLYTFFYALLHFMCFIFFELQLEWQLLISEIIKRPYITVGMTAFVLLLMMAITSTNGWQKKLGRKWQTLHNTVYLTAALVALHYIWSVKSDIIQPLIYIALSMLLLSARTKQLQQWLRRKKRQNA